MPPARSNLSAPHMVTKTPPDFNRDLGKLEGQMSIVIRLMWAVFPVIIAIGGSLFWLINDSTKSLGEKIIGFGDRLTKLETSVNAVKTGEDRFASDAAGALSRIEDRLAAAAKGQPTSPGSILLISTADAATIRNAVQSNFDSATAYNNVGKIGDIVSNVKLFEFPEPLINKYPLLKGTRYAFDIKGEIMIVTADQRVIAVLA